MAKEKLDRLIAEAQKKMKNAYAPYSGFKVGAAVLGESEKIYSGCNVENASFGLTICAERNAVFQAIAAGETKIQAVLIVSDAESPAPPCGACRQVLVEFAENIPVILQNLSGQRKYFKLHDLLPERFELEKNHEKE